MRAPTLRLGVLLAALLLVPGCGERAEERPAAAPPAASSTVPAPAPPPATPADARALEQTPGATPPLPDAVAPATAPVAGLPGTPDSSPAAGPADAPVRIYVFTDFQCPVCRRALEPLKLLVRRHPNDVRVVIKQAASPLHSRAVEAAAAGLAAFRQGKFWAYADRLFADQSQLDRGALLTQAAALGLDTDAFARDMDSEAVQAQVRYETALAGDLGLAATPSFVVNGETQRGWGSYAGLEAMVMRQLSRASQLEASGVPTARVAYEATRRAEPDGAKLAAALFEPMP